MIVIMIMVMIIVIVIKYNDENYSNNTDKSYEKIARRKSQGSGGG